MPETRNTLCKFDTEELSGELGLSIWLSLLDPDSNSVA